MGIDLDAQPNVHLDTEVRELKSPRAFCSPVRVPDEIYLVVLPTGGQDDYGMLLHEAGHTEHFAHVRPDLPFEYRHLGDNAVTEGFAFIFDHLLLNRRWLETSSTTRTATTTCASPTSTTSTSCGATPPSWPTRPSCTRRPARSRPCRPSTAAGSARPPRSTVPAENYLADVDDGFYCASYLRAWMLEGALRLLLQENYGMDWYASRDAGDWLKALWADGQHLTAERLLLRHGGGRLNTDPLRHLFEQVLGAEPRGRRPLSARQERSPARAAAAGRRTRRSRCPARCRAAGRRPRPAR